MFHVKRGSKRHQGFIAKDLASAFDGGGCSKPGSSPDVLAYRFADALVAFSITSIYIRTPLPMSADALIQNGQQALYAGRRPTYITARHRPGGSRVVNRHGWQ